MEFRLIRKSFLIDYRDGYSHLLHQKYAGRVYFLVTIRTQRMVTTRLVRRKLPTVKLRCVTLHRNLTAFDAVSRRSHVTVVLATFWFPWKRKENVLDLPASRPILEVLPERQGSVFFVHFWYREGVHHLTHSSPHKHREKTPHYTEVRHTFDIRFHQRQHH